MGRDKALLPWERGTLLSHSVERLRQVLDDVRLLSGSADRHALPGLSTVADVGAGLGPLGALRTALEDSAPQSVLLLAVDLPLVPVPLLSYLLRVSAQNDAVVPHSCSGPEPLVAVYSTACLDPVGRRLAAGERRMSSFWGDVSVRHIGPDEIAPWGDPERLFANINTPADLARWGP